MSLTTENKLDTLPINTKPAAPPAATKVRVPGTKADPKVKEISGKLKRALDLMVFGDEDGTPYEWNEAAQKVEFTVAAMRKALERPHVLRYLKEQKQVFRQSVSASNILHARRIRNQNSNAMASLGAIKLLEQLEENAPINAGAQRNVTPGITVVLQQNFEAPLIAHQERIEINPLIDNADVGHDQ